MLLSGSPEPSLHHTALTLKYENDYSRPMQRMVDALILWLVTFGSARIALYYLILPEGMAPFWFANGIVLAVLLRRPKEDWPFLLSGAYAGFLVNWHLGNFPAFPDIIYGLLNVLEPLIAATIIRTLVPRFQISKLRDLGLLIFASLIACLVSSLIAWAIGPVRWSLWFMDDWLGMLLITPALLVFWPKWKRSPVISLPKFRQALEMSAILVSMVLVWCALIFCFKDSVPFLFSYAPLPFLLWATLRFRTKGATIACLFLGLLTLSFAIYGIGPLSSISPSIIERSLMVQMFLAIVMLSYLSLGVSLAENARASDVERQQIKILKCISRDEPLEAVLKEIVLFVESREAGLICSLLLVDAKEGTIKHGSAPNLPEEYNRAIHGLRIGPNLGSCGAAAFQGRPVVVRDIATHPNWTQFKMQALKHGLRACWSTPVLSPTGEVLGTFAIYAKEIREPSGEEISWVSVATQLAAVAILKQRNEDEKATLEKQIQFARQMESLGTLASGIAHDFNNILTAIIGNVALVRRKVEHEESVHKNLDIIKSAGQRASALVQRILAFSRQTVAIRDPILLKPVVEEAIGLLRATLPAMIEVRTKFAPEEFQVLAESSQIHQILLNLGVNAAQAMEGTGGVLEVHLEPVTLANRLISPHSEIEPGRYMRLKVSDTGAGMSEEVLAKIFDPFFTTKLQGKGTGLGLSAVLGIVKGHEGAIVVETSPGKGASFSLYFPIVESTATNPGLKPEPESLRGQGQNILYVDDDLAVSKVVSELLQDTGYLPTTISNPVVALDKVIASPEHFSAILVDYEMPAMTGLEFLRKLRSRELQIPVILVSGFLNEKVIDQSRELKVHEVLIKPDFLDKVPGVLGQLLN